MLADQRESDQLDPFYATEARRREKNRKKRKNLKRNKKMKALNPDAKALTGAGAEEYKMLADQCESDQLNPFYAMEARRREKNRKKRKNWKRNKKMKALNPDAKALTVAYTAGKQGENILKALESAGEINTDDGFRSAIMIDPFFSFSKGREEKTCLGNVTGIPEIKQTEAPVREEEKISDKRHVIVACTDGEQGGNILKAPETIEEINTVDGFRSDIVIDLGLSFSEGHEETTCLGNVRGIAENEQTEAPVRAEEMLSDKRHNEGRGHLTRDCLEEPLSNKICLRCGESGHHMFSCQSDYSSEDLNKIQCYVCKEFGHLCCVGLKNEGQTVASCYQCGQTGHLGSERCTKYSPAKSFYNHEVECHFPGKDGEYNKARKCTHESTMVDISLPEKEIIPNCVNAPLKSGRGILSNQEQRLTKKRQGKEPMAAPPPPAQERGYVTWNSQMDALLTSTLFEQMKRGNVGHDDFKSQACQDVVDKLRLELGISVTEDHVKDRIEIFHYPLTEAFPPLTEAKQTTAELANLINKLPSSSDLAPESKGVKGKNVTEASGQAMAPTPQSLGERQRTESSDGNEIAVHIPNESCIFLSPASIESHIEAIPSPLEEEHLKRKCVKGATDDFLSSTCRAFLYALYMRNKSQGVSGESKSPKDIFDLIAENIKAGDELRLLHVELEAVEKKLEAEKKKTKELQDQLDRIAYMAMAKG